jgi:hypothetical protein
MKASVLHTAALKRTYIKIGLVLERWSCSLPYMCSWMVYCFPVICSRLCELNHKEGELWLWQLPIQVLTHNCLSEQSVCDKRCNLGRPLFLVLVQAKCVRPAKELRWATMVSFPSEVRATSGATKATNFCPSGVCALPLTAGINVGGHYLRYFSTFLVFLLLVLSLLLKGVVVGFQI